MDIPQALTAGMVAMGIQAPPSTATALARYIELLARWNRAFNLTAACEPATMVSRHVLDSLSVLPWVRGPRLLDVGSGAGLPGIPLALARPELHVTLLDSNGKKTRFMHEVVTSLKLANVEVVQVRAETWSPPEPFDTVVCRAFAELGEIWRATWHLCAAGGRVLAMKGALADAELASLPVSAQVVATHPLTVPGLAGERHVVQIEAAAGH